MEIKSTDYSDEILAKAFDLLFPYWKSRFSTITKSNEMKSIIDDKHKPHCDFNEWFNCIEFLINNKGK